MKLLSPLPLLRCFAILKEQVGEVSWLGRLNILKPVTTPVVGKVSENELVLESGRDRFSQRLIGRLSDVEGGTELDFRWERSLWTKVWGNPKFDEEEVLKFLSDWAGFSQPAERH